MSLKGDFISFTYNGAHSTDLGIVHVSASNRYTDNLLPTIQDKTVQVPGGHGTYFFGSYYTQRPITIDIAYDNLKENQVRKLRSLFGDGRSHVLVFDEEPYKVYYAKVSGTPNLKFIPFDSDAVHQGLVSSERVYKGEGTLTFICYEPFAHCPTAYKNLADWTVNANPIWYKFNNKDEWNLSAQLRDSSNFDKWTRPNGGASNSYFLLYNPGDLETDYKLYMPINDGITGIVLSNTATLESKTLSLRSGMTAKGNDTHVCFNTKINIIEGLVWSDATGYVKSGNIYNEYIIAGEWAKIPRSLSNNWQIQLVGYNGTTEVSQEAGVTLLSTTFSLPAGETERSFTAPGDMVISILTSDHTTGDVVLTDAEVIDRKVTIRIDTAYNHDIDVVIGSERNNQTVPFIEYDYLYL